MCVSARCGAATLESGHSPELIAPEGKLSRKPKFHQKPPCARCSALCPKWSDSWGGKSNQA